MFQFHIGAIRSYQSFSGFFCVYTFQFHIGAIRSISQTVIGGKWDMFQFHIGAIRSYNKERDIFEASEFQFHIGAIRRYFVISLGLSPFSFNSILVQLEVRRSKRRGKSCMCFNSILVQLEDGPAVK